MKFKQSVVAYLMICAATPDDLSRLVTEQINAKPMDGTGRKAMLVGSPFYSPTHPVGLCQALWIETAEIDVEASAGDVQIVAPSTVEKAAIEAAAGAGEPIHPFTLALDAATEESSTHDVGWQDCIGYLRNMPSVDDEDTLRKAGDFASNHPQGWADCIEFVRLYLAKAATISDNIAD